MFLILINSNNKNCLQKQKEIKFLKKLIKKIKDKSDMYIKFISLIDKYD